MLVVYSNGIEILVCDKKNEKKLIRTFFDPYTGRDINNYDRWEYKDFVKIKNSEMRWWGN